MGKDRYGPRMGRAVKFVKRVADPKDPMGYARARGGMRIQKSQKGLRKDRKGKYVKTSTVAKSA